MTLDKARELLANQAKVAGGYTRNGARLVLAEGRREHGKAAVDLLIRELKLDEAYGFKERMQFKRA